jgi:hypothetical protein
MKEIKGKTIGQIDNRGIPVTSASLVQPDQQGLKPNLKILAIDSNFYGETQEDFLAIWSPCQICLGNFIIIFLMLLMKIR